MNPSEKAGETVTSFDAPTSLSVIAEYSARPFSSDPINKPTSFTLKADEGLKVLTSVTDETVSAGTLGA